MRTFLSLLRALAVATAIGLSAPAFAQSIPKLDEVPPSLPDPPRMRMVAQRDALLTERSRLKARIDAHNAKTAEPGTEAARALRQEGAELRADLARHVAATNRFNADLRAQLAASAAAPPR